MLWVRCGVVAATRKVGVGVGEKFKLAEKYFAAPVVKKGLHGGGHGTHPRMEVKGMSEGVGALLREEALVGARCAEPVRRARGERAQVEAVAAWCAKSEVRSGGVSVWGRMEQAMRVTDLLLQAGGFSAIVLDMGSLAPEQVSRIPLATWFRYAAAAERSRTSVVLLTQHTCSKSSAGLVLRLRAGEAEGVGTVLGGLRCSVEVSRQRSVACAAKVVELRKPSQRVSGVSWGESCGVGGGAGMSLDITTKTDLTTKTNGEMYACLYAREFPAQAVMRLRPELREGAVVVVEGEAPLEDGVLVECEGSGDGCGAGDDAGGVGDV